MPHVQAAGVGLASQRAAGQQRARWAACPRGAGLGRGTPAMPRVLVSPLFMLWCGGSAMPRVPGCSCLVTAVEQLPVPCCLSQKPARKMETP